MSNTDTSRRSDARPALQVIDGGASNLPQTIRLPQILPPRLSGSELAADLAALFALALIAECPVAALSDPHHAVPLGGASAFTLHELLCELRSLPWHDSRNAQLAVAQAQGTATDHARARRALRWNADEQLTLRNLFRSGVALRGGAGIVSPALAEDHSVAEPVGPCTSLPESATLSDWLTWCAMQSGAGLRLPGAARLPTPRSLAALAGRVRRTPPARPFHNAVLAALGRGVPFDTGLGAGPSRARLWTAPRLMRLMAQAEARAVRVAMRAALQADRPTRPVVTAARMTVMLARENRTSGPEGATLAAAAEELAAFAPNLVDWVSHANVVARGSTRFPASLFLPLGRAARDPAHPSDFAAHAVVAGALATLTKAVFDTENRLRVPDQGETGPAPELADNADRLAANFCLARSVSGTHYPAEDFADLRTGEAIALHLLRDMLEADNRSATLGFRDFDGREVRIATHPRSFGRGQAALRRDGLTATWPQDETRPAAHLTAVI